MRPGDLLGSAPGEAAVVGVAEPDRRLGVGALLGVEEPAGGHVGPPVVRGARVVVDRQPFLVVEDGLVGRADPSALALEHGGRLAPVDAAVERLTETSPWATKAPPWPPMFSSCAINTTPWRRSKAGDGSPALSVRIDLPVDPGRPAVKGGEEPSRDDRPRAPVELLNR